MWDGEAFGREIAEAVSAAITRSTETLQAQIQALKQEVSDLRERAPEKGDQGERGDAGRDGSDGRDGPTIDDLRPIIEGAIAEAMKALPAPEPGAKGDPGRDGKDAPPPTTEQVEAAVRRALEPTAGELNPIAEQVRRYMEIFPPKDGRDGRDGIDGKDGADGVGLASAMIDREGHLVVTLTNGDTRPLGVVVGRDGTDGKDGENGARGEAGFSLDDFEISQPDLRTMVLSFTRGEVKESYELSLGGFIDRGVYKAGESYELGDAVTWGGSLWIAQGPTTDRPEGSKAWRLAVKKGRDGKDGKDGEKGPEGKKGDPGLNGRAHGA